MQRKGIVAATISFSVFWLAAGGGGLLLLLLLSAFSATGCWANNYRGYTASLQNRPFVRLQPIYSTTCWYTLSYPCTVLLVLDPVAGLRIGTAVPPMQTLRRLTLY